MLILLAPQVLLKRLIAFIQPSLSIYPNCTLNNYLVTGEVPVKILSVIFCLVNNHRWYEALAIRYGEDQSSTPEGGSLSCFVFTNAFPCEELVFIDNSDP